MHSRILSLPMALVVLTFAAAVIGCSSREDKWTKGRPPVYPTSGRIVLDGEPVEKATVTFQPVDSEGRGGSAITDANGYFEAQTFDPGDGLTAGKHLVAVKKTAFVDKDGNVVKEIRVPGAAKEKSLVPEKYSKYEDSGIEIEVSSSGENDLGDLNLSK